MIAITITPAAYEAIRATLPDGAPRSIGPDGQMRIWLDRRIVDRLRALRGPRRELQRRDPAAGGSAITHNLGNLRRENRANSTTGAPIYNLRYLCITTLGNYAE